MDKVRHLLFLLVVNLCLVDMLYAAGRPFVTLWQWEKGQKVTVPIYGHNVRGTVRALNHPDTVFYVEINPHTLYSFVVPYDDTYEMCIEPEGVKYFRISMRPDFLPTILDNPNNEEDDKQKELSFRESLLRIEQWGDVEWLSMREAFSGCGKLELSPKAGVPNLSRVRSCQSMFAGTRLNTDINDWDVSHVEDMQEMFLGCVYFNQPLDSWDVGQVRNMERMFAYCKEFNQPLASWNVGQVRNMKGMFYLCGNFNQPLAAWNVSRVENMYAMFAGCKVFNQPLGAWDVANVEDMKGMFEAATSFNQNLGSWHLQRCKELSLGMTALDFENLRKTLVAWSKQEDLSSELILSLKPYTYSSEEEPLLKAMELLELKYAWRFKSLFRLEN